MSRTIQASHGAWPRDENSVGIAQRLARPFVGVATYVAEMRRRSLATAELERLDDRMLQDIGVSRSDIPAIVRSGRQFQN